MKKDFHKYKKKILKNQYSVGKIKRSKKKLQKALAVCKKKNIFQIDMTTKKKIQKKKENGGIFVFIGFHGKWITKKKNVVVMKILWLMKEDEIFFFQ